MMMLPPEPKSLPKRKSMMEDNYDEDEEEMAMMRE
jgi:SPRY domain